MLTLAVETQPVRDLLCNGAHTTKRSLSRRTSSRLSEVAGMGEVLHIKTSVRKIPEIYCAMK
jgi:hypothetical protein